MTEVIFEQVNVKEENTELTIEEQQNLGIVKLSVTDQAIADLKEQYSGMTVAGLEDKKGLKAVFDARQIVKKTRIAAEKYADELKDKAIEWQKKVNAEKTRVVGELKAIESDLQAEEDRIEGLKEEARKEAERIENERIQIRIDKLAEYNLSAPVAALKALDDAAFEAVRANAQAQFEKSAIENAERERIEQEAADKLKKEQDKQKEALRIQQEAFAKEQAEAKAKQDEIDKENARIKAEQDAGAEVIRLERLALQKQKDDVEAARLKVIRDAEEEAEKEAKRLQVIETARLQAIAEIEAKVIADEKEAADKLAEEKRQLALRPDKDKLLSLAAVLNKIEYPELTTPEAIKAADDTKTLITRAITFLNKQIITL